MNLPGRPSASLRSDAAGGAIVAALTIALLYFGRSVLIPITLAALLSFVLTPLASRLQRVGLGRAPAVLVVTLLGFVLVGGALAVVAQQATSLVDDLPRYQTALEQKASALKAGAQDGPLMRNLAALVARLRGGSPPTRAEAPSSDAASSSTAAEPVAPPQIIVQPAPLTPYELGRRYLTPILEPVFTAGVVVTFLIFILLERETLRDRLIWLLGSGDLRRTTRALDEVATRLSRYFLVQTSINIVFGLILGAGLWAIGIPNFALWGALAALLRFLPYVGAVMSAAMPLVLAAAIEPGWTKLLWTAGLFGLLELTAGQVIEPLLFGKTTGMSPLAVIFAAAFWTALWGPVGLLLSTPLTLLLVAFGQHIERFRVFAALLGETPPLAPSQSFYHKIIAEKVGEASAQAHAAVKENGLIGYYDAYVLPALNLLQGDLESGALLRENVPTILESVSEVVDTLDEDDGNFGEPTASPHPSPIYCMGGRSPFDRNIAAILAQCLQGEGIAAAVVDGAVSPPPTPSRVCLSFMSAEPDPGNVRLWVRRARRRFPDSKVLLGLWTYDALAEVGVEAPAMVEFDRETWRKESGADDVVATLRDAVETCRHWAAAPAAAPEDAAISAAE